MANNNPIVVTTVDFASKEDAKKFIKENIDEPDEVVKIEVVKDGNKYTGTLSTQVGG